MIEMYAFLAAFVVQIFAMSVLYPARFIRYWREQVRSIPAERLAQLYPGVDLNLAQTNFLTRYRALNVSIAALGILLLGWLVTYMQRPDWTVVPVQALVAAYFMLQALLPMGVIAWLAVRFNKLHKRSLLDGKRKATLQRRGLFDFVSPSVVLTAVLCYFLFAAFVIHIQQPPLVRFAGLVIVGIVTLVYAVNAFTVYTVLYGKRSNPFETSTSRARAIGLTVKGSVYSCIAIVVFLSLNFTLVLLDLQRWEPLALSVFFVVVAVLSSMSLNAPPRQPEAEGLAAAGES